MNFVTYVEQIPNVTLAKRLATAYVVDSRRSDFEEVKEYLIKAAQQYISYENISARIEKIKLDNNRAVRIIAPIFLRDFLLNQDDFISTQKETDAAILNYEKAIVDESNNFDIYKMSKDFALFKFMIDTAWKHNNDISVDEKNLLESLRKYLGITTREQHMLDAKSGRFPNFENSLHSFDDIEETRRVLQANGLIVAIRNSDGVMCDMIPDDIACSIRRYFGIEIRTYGYEKLLDCVVKKTRKQYLIDIVEKANKNSERAKIDISINPNIAELREVILKYVQPSNLLGGFSARDGLNAEQLWEWCVDLGLGTGNKETLITKLLNYYDTLRRIEVVTEDLREKYIAVYKELACRDLKYLRANNIIEKDLQCEHYFEDATNYIFEKLLLNKPLTLTGTEHPDGKLSFKDKYIMWDNKSKETPVNLKDHIQQFDRYIKTSDKDVVVFMVIAPEFTPQSVQECVDYSLNNDAQILLITAEELKMVAETWKKKHPGEIFNLGYFKQNGRFDITKLNL